MIRRREALAEKPPSSQNDQGHQIVGASDRRVDLSTPEDDLRR